MYYTLIILFLINLINYLDRYLISGGLSTIQAEFGLTNAEAGALMTVFMMVYMLACPIFGWLGDRYSRKYLIATGVFLWSFAASSVFFVRSYVQLLFCRSLAGVGEASYATTAPTVIADIVPLQKRGRALAFFYLAIPVGSALGFMLGGWMASNYNWRYAFVGSGILGLIMSGLILTIREPKRGQSDDVVPATQVPWKQALPTLRKTPSFVWITLGLTAMTFAMGGLAHWMPSFLIKCRGVPEKVAGLYFGAVTVVAGILGTLVGGWLGDFYQKKHSGAYFALCSFSMFMGIPFAILAFLIPHPWIFWACIFLAEFFLFLNTGPGNTIIANVVPASIRATAFAVNTFFIHFLGDAISPTIVGILSDTLAKFGIDKLASLNYSMYIMPVVMALSGFFFFMGISHLQPDTQNALRQS